MNILSLDSAGSVSPVQERNREEEARERRQEQQAQMRLGPSPSFNRKLEYEVDHKSHDLTVKVIDGETDKVIRTLPSEEFREMRENIREAIGLLFDKHA